MCRDRGNMPPIQGALRAHDHERSSGSAKDTMAKIKTIKEELDEPGTAQKRIDRTHQNRRAMTASTTDSHDAKRRKDQRTSRSSALPDSDPPKSTDATVGQWKSPSPKRVGEHRIPPGKGQQKAPSAPEDMHICVGQLLVSLSMRRRWCCIVDHHQ